jgi:2-dehydro-3-deoxyphosphogluconate aldolase/(4S)-4-hydroxy-2-oxoglutarate aldolase
VTPWHERLRSLRVVPVAVIGDAGAARPLARALADGGLPCVEVTLRTPGALAAIASIAQERDVLLGAGTVVRAGQVDEAVDAGARFVVTPGFSLAVLRRCAQRDVPVLPGVATATEIQMALDEGIETVKFFPAEAMGGLATLSALSSAFPAVRFVPTGGLTAANLAAYLAHPSVLCIGGSWMASRDLLAAGRWDEVTRLTQEAVALAAGAA